MEVAPSIFDISNVHNTGMNYNGSSVKKRSISAKLLLALNQRLQWIQNSED